MNIIKQKKNTITTALKIFFIAFSIICIASCNKQEESKNKTKMKTNNSEHIILINPFEVPKGKLEESVKYWEACRDFLKKEPGYISTKLHKSIKEDAKFELINVAVWESPKAFMDASKKMSKELGVPPTEGLKANPSLYNVISE
ncbi:antibiotic biosynthesis monooxygenase family protein [uncultured Tenacibaculum sp.]|uniref:antibiotic biosynthesis monooxygenase family protein n=1 Tax=uncultured Tenacibaculum sp. TaxID=174713 RepID=UPI0026034AE0|nr:antibiotic biosynthesis monooxygenase family protein [uncultured Tenacibaculum sp.]